MGKSDRLLAEYALGWQLGIDELLFRDTADTFNAIRGRMSPYSAVVFATIDPGLAAVPLRPMHWLVWVTASLSV